MKAIAKKSVIQDNPLEEEVVRIRFEKDGKIFEGALFFKAEPWSKEKEVLVEEVLEADTDKELVDKAIAFYKANWAKTYDSTDKTMKHWQFMNGFTETILW